MRAGVTNTQALARADPIRSLPTLNRTISHTRELPYLKDEYSVVVS